MRYPQNSASEEAVVNIEMGIRRLSNEVDGRCALNLTGGRGICKNSIPVMYRDWISETSYEWVSESSIRIIVNDACHRNDYETKD